MGEIPAARRPALELSAYIDGVRGCDPAILGRAISLVESEHEDHRCLAESLLEALLPHTGRAQRVGVTGVPGVGKSTFIEAFGQRLLDRGHRVAVLAVDPSSAVSGGSILGDKTRMPRLSADPRAFIRPSPTSGALGGVHRRTHEVSLVCEAAGFDVVLVETVGVGQSEIAVARLVDVMLVLMLAGAGDELQGIKRGIIEVADVLAINKADGDGGVAADQARAHLEGALRFMRPASPGWRPRVLTCSGLTGAGLDEIWDALEAHRATLEASGERAERRRSQRAHWMWSELEVALLRRLKTDSDVSALLAEVEDEVRSGRLPPTAGARRLLSTFDTPRS